MKTLLSLIAVATLLCGCVAYTPAGSEGGFCPPGQAKKGNC